MLRDHVTLLLDSLALIFVIIILSVVNFSARPVKRGFDATDSSIANSMEQETISTAVLLVISFLIPAVVMAVFHFFSRDRRNIKFRNYLQRIIELIQVLLLVNFATIVIKMSYGELRPDFLARCVPNASNVCTGSEKLVNEGRVSFPSGHSSTAWSGMVYLSLFMVYEWELFQLRWPNSQKNKAEDQGEGTVFARVLLVFIPLLIAALVSVSRVVNNRHFPHDVIGGAILGICVAFLIFYAHLLVPREKRYFYRKTSEMEAIVIIPSDKETSLDGYGDLRNTNIETPTTVGPNYGRPQAE